jgi:Phage tail sheath protein subtilisin-like domain
MGDSNRVFVSPGVYTRETDLTFVAQSVGVTTLGLVGETLMGPAFEPLLITDFNEFKTYFGGTSPDLDGIGNPKYELPYVAKSYLQESNQLFVTRILGLTGYLPKITFGIKTLGSINVGSTLSPVETLGTSTTGGTGTFYTDLSGKTSIDGTSVPQFITSHNPYTIGDWFTIGLVPSGDTTSLTGTTLPSPIGDFTNFVWSNAFYTTSGSNVNGLYAYLFVYGTGATFNVTRYNYTGATVNKYDGLVVAALRSRGYYSGLLSSSPTLMVTQTTGLTLSDTAVETNPLGEFTVTINTDSGLIKTFTCSLDSTSTHYITKVFGVDVYDKDYNNYPLYVYESYSTLVTALTERGLLRGLNLTPVAQLDSTKEFLTQWDTPLSPTVVSEVRGGKVADLFSIIPISDGDTANYQIKISIMNINLETSEFDLVVRDFNDTDDNIVTLEKYSRCTMDKELPGYVALKIGTSDGKYPLNSKYIMLSMASGAPIDAVPAGFKGFTSSSLSSSPLGNVLYKTEYYQAGDVVTYTNGVADSISGDKIRRETLGLSSSVGFDDDLFKFKGKSAAGVTPGFHLSVNASTITGATISGFEFDTTPYDLEGQTGDYNPLTTLANCKFTFAVCGGFDGWDIYRNVKTFNDAYIFGKTTYKICDSDNGGVFNNKIGNSDYYAYLQGIETFQNPEAVDINVFATPGINFLDHSSLTEQAIDMIEVDRADSLYIIAAPGPVTITDAQDAADELTNMGLDSNYSATYWPWIQYADTDNSTQIYIPPTGEVVKNIALTDNVSYPWFAVAGYSRGLVNSIKAYKKLTLDERDYLYKNRINPIATFSDTGTIIWGNKTLQVKESALDRINVRRLLLRTRKLVSAVAVRLLFEQNDDEVRNEFTRLVNPILESIKKERGLYDFRLTVSNDPEDLDQNTLRGKIYIKPTRSLEFIDIDFIVTPTGASFENI